MDVSLRLFLMLVGVLLVAVVFFDCYRRQRSLRAVNPNPHEQQAQSRATLAEQASSPTYVGDVIEEPKIGNMNFLDEDIEDVAWHLPDTKSKGQKQTILSLFVMAKTGCEFYGYELLEILLSVGLHFGEQGVFHYHIGEGQSKEILFSVSSAAEPGTFSMSNMNNFSCPGLCLFLQPDKVTDTAQAIESMIEIADALSQKLQARLLDSKGNTLSSMDLAVYRELLETTPV